MGQRVVEGKETFAVRQSWKFFHEHTFQAAQQCHTIGLFLENPGKQWSSQPT